MLNISQFAKACDTTVKTIRYYDNIGLLKADYTSEESGYRYYRRNSVVKYRQIAKLKLSGFTLKEIKENFSSLDAGNKLIQIKQKILLLKKQQEMCESIKKEYERIMAESKMFNVSKTESAIRVRSKETGGEFEFAAKDNIANECTALLDNALNEEQFIAISFEDLKNVAEGKTAFSAGRYYSPNLDISAFDNVEVTRNDEKALAIIVAFEASPETDPETVSNAISSFLMSFPKDITVLFSANFEYSEKGLSLQWICLE